MAATASPMASQLRSSFASSTRGLIIPKGISAAPLRVLPCRRNSSFTIKAVQTDKPTYQVIQPINGDPFIGSLETPMLCSTFAAALLCFGRSFFASYRLYRKYNAHVSDSDRYVAGLGRYGREIHSHRYTGEYPTRWWHIPVRTGRYGTYRPIFRTLLSNLPAYRTAVSPLLRGIEVGLAHGYLLVGPFVKTGPLRDTPVAGPAGSLAAGGLVVILSICLTMYGIASFKEGEPSTAPALTLTGRKKEPDQLQTADGWAKFTGGFFFGGISGVIWAYFLLYVLDLPYYVK